MLSFKRLLCIILTVAILGGIFQIYSINGSRLSSKQISKREFIEASQVNEGERPKVWILGNIEDSHCGEVYKNVRQFCKDIHLSIIETEYLDVNKVKKQDLVIFCNTFIQSYVDLADLEKFIATGGRIILAAGLAEGSEESKLWPVFGIKKKSVGEDYHNLMFKKSLLPVQPEEAYYNKNSHSVRIEVSTDAAIYIQDAENNVPIVYTYDWKSGSVCFINGLFLADICYMGLLSGAISVLLPDFIYPVLGVKSVFIDNFPIITSANDKLCRQLYGYSVNGFLLDVVWPTFQGVFLRTDTPCTSSVLAASSFSKDFGTVDDASFVSVGKSVLQFNGELAYGANCSENGKVVFNKKLTDQFSKEFSSYTVQGLTIENDNFSPKMLDVPNADIHTVRGLLGSSNMRFYWNDKYTIFPAATKGNSMEDGNLFSIYSTLGAYGMVSHVFDVNKLIAKDGNTTAWDLGKRQISLFESEVLTYVPWLESRTLSQTNDDVRSYLDMDYGWTKSGSRIELNVSNVVKDQAFFYHTNSRIVDAKGVTYQDVGNGYYLLHIQEKHGIIMLEGEK